MTLPALLVWLLLPAIGWTQGASTAEENLKRLNLTLPAPATPAGNYVPAVRAGNLLFLAGTGPVQDQARGKVGKDLTRDQAYQAARTTGLNVLSMIRTELGSLDRVTRIVKVSGMVNAAPGFTELPQVLNGFSDLMVEVFGPAIGKHARSVAGVAELNGNLPVAVEVIVEFSGSATAAPDRVLGLLSLPEVFGNGPCHPFEPGAVSLFEAPNAAAPMAVIQVDQHWSFAPHGGCEGLTVSVHRNRARAALPTLEYANETPAAIVLEAREGWFKIRLTNETAWLQPSARDRFMPLADLFSEYPTLTALTDAHSGPLREGPEDAVAAPKAVLPGSPVRVLELRERGNRTWLHVAVMSHSICESSAGPPEVVSLGWLPAHAASGEPTVWFSSRGC